MKQLIHTYHHRLDRKHNVLLLLVPGLIFTLVLAVYLLLRIQILESLPVPNAYRETSQSY